MTTTSQVHLILCNGAELPIEESKNIELEPLRLEYEDSDNDFEPNVKISLLKFIQDVNYLPERIRDLLEIAAYVFSADRSISRGHKDLVEYHSWSRTFHFVIKVRDFEFWQNQKTIDALSKALTFMSGDMAYNFTFLPGRPMTVTNLFDSKEFLIEPNRESIVALFSGGLDSLAGVLDILNKTKKDLYLVSHQSSQPSTIKTQNRNLSIEMRHIF